MSHDSNLSGANRSLLGIVKNIKKYDIEPIVLIPQWGEFSEELKKNKIKCIISKYYWGYYPATSKGWIYDKVKFILNFYLRNKILNEVKKIQIDIIHINCSVIIDTGLYLSKKLNIPNVIHFREYGKEDHNLSYRFGLKYLMKEINKYGNKIIFISEDLKSKFNKYLNEIPLKNKVVIYNGIEYTQLEIEKNYNEIKRICIFGTISKGKNQMSVIELIPDILKKHPKLELYIYGTGNKYYLKKIKKFILKNNLENNVFMMKAVKDSMKEMEKMNIGIMCSRKEAFGRVTVEYMLSKLAVIASDSGANKEIIKNDKTGLLYKLGDSKDLKNKIEYLLNNKNSLRKLAENGYVDAIKKFTADNNAKQIYEKVYSKM